MNYQEYFDKLSERYFNYLKNVHEAKQTVAVDKEYATLFFICGISAPHIDDDFKKELTSLFQHYYKLNPNSAITKLLEKLNEIRERHMIELERSIRVTYGKKEWHKIRNGNWFERTFGKFINTKGYKEYKDYDKKFLNERSLKVVVKFLVKFFVSERFLYHIKSEYPNHMNTIENDEKLIERFFPPKSNPNGLKVSELVNFIRKFNITKGAVAYIVRQLIELSISDKDEEKKALETNPVKFLKLIDPRFIGTSDETIKEYFTTDKHLPKTNRIELNLIRKVK